MRIIVDTTARIPLEARVLNTNSKARTIIAASEKANSERLKALEEKGAEVIISPLKNEKVDLKFLMKALGERNIDSVLLEGGSELNYAAIQDGIVDKINAFISPKIIGGSSAKTPVGGEGKAYMKDAVLLNDIHIHRFDQDIMIEGYIDKQLQLGFKLS